MLISKISNLVPATVQNEQSEDASNIKATTQSVNQGIAQTSDGFENAGPTLSVYLHSTDAQHVAGNIMSQPLETVNANQIFQFVGNLDSEIFQPKAVENQPPATPAKPEVNWDAVLFVKEEIEKNPMDWEAVQNKLFEGSANKAEVFETLNQLLKEGDIERFLSKLPPEGYKKLQDQLTSLALNQSAHPRGDSILTEMLRKMDDGSGRFSGIIRGMLQQSKEKITSDQAEQCMKILNDDQNPQTRLSSLFAMKQIIQPPHVGSAFPDSVVNSSIEQFIDGYLNGTVQVPPPAIQEAFQNYPGQAGIELVNIKHRGQLAAFANQITASGENIGKALPELLHFSIDYGELGWTLREFFQELRTQSPSKADDIVRDALNNLGQFSDSLSKLSPSLLIQMKLVLEQGDDTDLNQQLIDNVIDPAFEIAKNL